MKIRDIKDQICLLIAGNINDEMDHDKVSLILEHNEQFLNNFDNKVFCLNRYNSIPSSEVDKTVNLIKNKVPDSIMLFDVANRGHQIGHVDLDKIGFFYIKNNIKKCKFTLKMSIDMLVKDKFMDLEIDDNIDFFYQPSINLDDYAKYNDIYYKEFIKNDFFHGLCPQTIFYMMSNEIDFPYEAEEVIDKCYDDWIQKGYRGVDQKLVLACEHSLNKSIIRNKFNRQSMFDENTFYKIINYMIKTKNNDCTLKNIYVPETGICHWQHKYEDTSTCE